MSSVNAKAKLGSGMYGLGAHTALFKQQLILIDGKLCYCFKTESITSLELKLGLTRDDRCQQKKYLHAIYRQWFMRHTIMSPWWESQTRKYFTDYNVEDSVLRSQCFLSETHPVLWMGSAPKKWSSLHLKPDQNHQLARLQTLPIFL